MKTKIQLERVLCWHEFYGIKETIVYGIMREKRGSRVSKRYAHGMNGTLLTATTTADVLDMTSGQLV
jgi:hypothetical protein